MQPVIGIPPTVDARGRWRAGREYHYIDSAYAAAIQKAGAVPLYVPQDSDVAAVLDHIDGLLIPGGDDFVPERAYPDHVTFDPIAEPQLAFDRALLGGALERDMPFLGICYGMQLLALHAGGRLIYDISVDCEGAGEHRLPPDARHTIRIAPDTLLHRLLGANEAPVNSWHHQGVAVPGDGLRPCAATEDGVLEGIEGEGRTFCLGVQWHPEKMDAAHRDAVIGSFVRACNA